LGPCSGTYCDGPLSYQIDLGVPRPSSPAIPTGASSIAASSVSQGNLLTTYYVDPHLKSGYSQNYNLAVQQELGASYAFELAYVGSTSHHLPYKVGDINRPDPVTGVRPTTSYLGSIEAQYSRGDANYNGLQTKVTKRFTNNLNFLASYTWAHNRDNGPSPFNLGQNSDYPQDPRNLRAEWGSADTDVRHTFTFSGIYKLPFGRGQALLASANRGLDMLVGGWQLNSIFTVRTGTPVNVFRSTYDKQLQGLRPDLVGNPTGTPPTAPGPPSIPDRPYYAFNIGAFSDSRMANCNSQQDPYCFYAPGTAGRNLVNGPGFVNADLSLFKEFSLSEIRKFQTRLEVFNITNSPHFCGPGGAMDDPSNYGVINYTCGSMREVQLDVKFIF